jgi:hypothetical protein
MSKKIDWPNELQGFSGKVETIMAEHLEPLLLSVDSTKEDEVLALCVAYLSSAFQLMHQMKYPKEEVEKRVLATLDLVWLAAELMDDAKKALH